MPSWAFSKQLIVSNVWEVFLQPFLLVILDVLILATNLAIWPPKKDLLLLWSHFILACLFSTLLTLNCWIENCWGFPWARQWPNAQSLLAPPPHVQCLLLPWWYNPACFCHCLFWKSSGPSHFQEKCALLWCMLNTAAMASCRRALKHTTASCK